jgi:hypothetical protein
MHRSLLLPTAALAGALALGCADQPTPSEPAELSQPSFRTEQNPEGPGALVLRGQPAGAPIVAEMGGRRQVQLSRTRAGF